MVKRAPKKSTSVKRVAKTAAKSKAPAKRPATTSVAKKRMATQKAHLKAAAKRPIKKVRQGAKKALVPHSENNFRPYLMRLRGVAGVIALVLFVQIAYGYITTGGFQVLGRVTQITTEGLLQETNKQRESEGYSSLQLNEDLSTAAYLKARDMLKHDYWAHTSPQGVEPWKWLGDVGYNYSAAGENLAKNYPTDSSTVDAWMNSPTHRANILNGKYSEVGFATVSGSLDGSQSTVTVALYASPARPLATQAAPPAAVFATSTTNVTSNPLAYFGSALQSLSPATVMALILMGVVSLVGAVTHRYRHKLPKGWQKSWRANQGMYTFYGMILFGVLLILVTGGGQI